MSRATRSRARLLLPAPRGHPAQPSRPAGRGRLGRSATATCSPSTPGRRRRSPNCGASRSCTTSCSPPTTRTLAAQIAEALGYELEEDETQKTDEDEDPLAQYDERLGPARADPDRTRAGRGRRRLRRRRCGEIVDEQLDQLGLDKDDQDWVLAYAINALPITEEGLPDIEQAYQVFAARETARQRKWAQTKRAPRTSRRTGRPRPRPPTSTTARNASGLDDSPHAGGRAGRLLGASGRGRNPFPARTAGDATDRSLDGAACSRRHGPSDRLQKQFEDKNAPLGRIESIRGTMIGTPGPDPGLGRALRRLHVGRRRRRRPEPGAAAADRAGALDARLQLVPDRARHVRARAGVRLSRCSRSSAARTSRSRARSRTRSTR